MHSSFNFRTHPLFPSTHSPSLLQAQSPSPFSPGGSTCTPPSPQCSYCLTGFLAEIAPYGSARGWWQHGPLQLHSHGLDPHSAGHKDCQGYGQFDFHLSHFHMLSSSFCLNPNILKAELSFLCWTRNFELFLMLNPLYSNWCVVISKALDSICRTFLDLAWGWRWDWM